MLRLFWIAAAVLLCINSVNAGDAPGDRDTTPVPFCNQLPPSAVIEVFSKADVEGICRAMGLLDGVRVEDIREFSKSSYLLIRWGYEGAYPDIARQLVEIVRLRGL